MTTNLIAEKLREVDAACLICFGKMKIHCEHLRTKRIVHHEHSQTEYYSVIGRTSSPCPGLCHRLARELATVCQERMRERLVLQYGFADNRKIDEGKYAVQQMMKALPLEAIGD